MNQDFSDELISAYLDGELTPEEQAQVEQMLVESEEHRRLFEELRALRDSLQSLPSYQLPDEFADRVLRRAQRAMSQPAASQPAGSQSAASQSAASQPATSRSEAAQSSVSISSPDTGNWRTAVAAMAGVAAALVISIVLLPPSNPTVPSVVRNHDAGVHSDEDVRSDEKGERKLASEDSVSEDLMSQDATFKNDSTLGKSAFGNFTLESETDESEELVADKIDAIKDHAKKQNVVDSSPPNGSATARSERVPVPPASAVAAPSRNRRKMSKQAQQAAGNKSGDHSRGQKPSNGAPANEKFAAPVPAAAKRPSAPAIMGGFGGVAKADGEASEAAPTSNSMLAQAEVDRYVVIVDMADKAFASRALDRALVRRGIAMSTSLEIAEQSDPSAKEREKVAGAKVAGEAVAENAAPIGESRESNVTNGNVDVVLVQAPVAQIQATLDELHRSGDLVRLAIHPEYRAADGLVSQLSLTQPTPDSMEDELLVSPVTKYYRKSQSGKPATTDSKVVGNDSRAASSSPSAAPTGPRAAPIDPGAAPSKKLDAARSLIQDKPSEAKAGRTGKNKGSSVQRAKQSSGKDTDKLAEDHDDEDRDRQASESDAKEEAKKKLNRRSSGYALRVGAPEAQESIQRLERSYRSSAAPQGDASKARLGMQREAASGGGDAAELFKFAENAPANQRRGQKKPGQQKQGIQRQGNQRQALRQQDAQNRIIHLSLVIRSVPSSPAAAAPSKADTPGADAENRSK